jgi:nitroreductase
MDFFEVVEKRRSIRRFLAEPFPDASVRRALEAALLAPNSSNVQTWDFHWVKDPALKSKVVEDCLGQSAARTATQLVVVCADPKLWKRSQAPLVEWVTAAKAPAAVITYYQKLIPFMYRWGLFNSFAPFKWILMQAAGLFRPMTRGPVTRRDLEEVAARSAALAAENFMLAITALGGASCPMEGFDSSRLRRHLKLRRSTVIVMVIGVGFEADKGTWGPRFRLPFEQVVHEHL